MTGSETTRMALEVEDLHVYLGESHILHGVSFEIPEGGITALLGRNGAGKTTTIEILEGFRDRSAGKVPILVARPCAPIEGVPSKVGERVPCVSVVANRSARGSDNLYQFVSPMPVAWATPDKTVWREAEKQIPEGEWETLRQNIDRVGEVSAEVTRMLPLE